MLREIEESYACNRGKHVPYHSCLRKYMHARVKKPQGLKEKVRSANFRRPTASSARHLEAVWTYLYPKEARLRTNGVNTNGVAAKVI